MKRSCGMLHRFVVPTEGCLLSQRIDQSIQDDLHAVPRDLCLRLDSICQG